MGARPSAPRPGVRPVTILAAPGEDTGSHTHVSWPTPHRRSADYASAQHSGPGLTKAASEPLYEPRIVKQGEWLPPGAEGQATANWDPGTGHAQSASFPRSQSRVFRRQRSHARSVMVKVSGWRPGVEMRLRRKTTGARKWSGVTGCYGDSEGWQRHDHRVLPTFSSS